MKSQPLQLDVFKDSREQMASHWRAAGETALVDWNYSPTIQQKRHDYYMDIADKIERGIK